MCKQPHNNVSNNCNNSIKNNYWLSNNKILLIHDFQNTMHIVLYVFRYKFIMVSMNNSFKV